jgi:hypothetical protein
LKWNAERDWTFTIKLRQPVMYLLRDHINMFTDLARDWTSGPPSDYFRFVPTNYAVQLEVIQYQLNLYLNDHNVIDKPLTREENGMPFVEEISALLIFLQPFFAHPAPLQRLPLGLHLTYFGLPFPLSPFH